MNGASGPPKVAIVHDWLTGMRGGEKVLEAICELFPRAPVYTLVRIPGSVSDRIESRPIRTSFAQRLPAAGRWYRHYLPLYPAVVEFWDFDRFDLVFDYPEMARHSGNLGGRSGFLGFNLVTHGGDRFRIRADENDAGSGKGLWEGLALRQKAIPRVHSFGTALLASGDDFLDDQVTFGRRWRPNGNGGIRQLYVQSILVGLRIDGNRTDPQFARGLDDPAGNFAAIGDQDTLEHAVTEAPGAGLFACGVIEKKSIAP